MDEEFMKNVNIRLTSPVDSLCDYTFNFHYLNQKLDPDSLIPDQAGSSYTYQDLVDALKDGADVHIKGDVGERLAYSMGVDLKHMGGSGRPEPAGRVFVDGSVGSEAGMGMVSGALYISGTVQEPLGNVIEVAPDVDGYRKFCSITDIMCSGPGEDTLVFNSFDKDDNIHCLLDNMVHHNKNNGLTAFLWIDILVLLLNKSNTLINHSAFYTLNCSQTQIYSDFFLLFFGYNIGFFWHPVVR